MGLLDDYMGDPVNQGLLAASAGLLQAGGPSRMPVSFSQALGQGLQGFQAGYKGGLDQQKENVQLQMLLQRQAMVNQALSGELGGGIAPRQPAYSPTLGQGADAGTVGTTPGGVAGMGIAPQGGLLGNAPVPAPTQSASFWPDSKIRAFAMSGDPGLTKAAELEQARKLAAQTDITKLLDAAGVTDPGLRAQYIQANLAKTNYVAPVNARPGSILRDPMDPSKIVAFNPHIPEGGMPQFDGSGNVVGIASLPGAAGVTQGMAQATAAGKNSVEPQAGFGPNGQPMYGNKLAAATGGQLPVGRFSGDPAATLQSIMQIANPQDRAAAFGAFQRQQSGGQGSGITPAPRIGTEGLVSDMQKDYTSNVAPALQQAQTTSSYLQSIKGLAANASIGSLSSQLALANGLLAAVGSERATNTQTANNLLDKYHEQIVARLGSGGMATDSARAILDGAYPGRKMNLQAIGEASDNLVGANDLVRSRAQVLGQHYTNLDPQTYNQVKQTFDQNADPRIWQWKNIADPAKRKAFAAEVMRQDPTFPARIDALQKIGAIK